MISRTTRNPRFSRSRIGLWMIAVKAFPVLMAMSVSALAASSDPGETALQFMEKVRAKTVNLEPGSDTALSPQTGEAKRKEIARRLERMSKDLGNDPLEVGAVKLDGELAAVLVRKLGGFDPGRLQVFPVALVKREAGWSAAPVPASFENSGVGYASALRKRLESLENWMLQERVTDLEQLREQSAARMRRNIEQKLPLDELRKLSAQEAIDRFLAACEHRHLPEMLGLLGGLSARLPDDWALRLNAADTAVSNTALATRPWHLLIAPEVLRVLVYQEDDGSGALASIACLDPAGNAPQTLNPKVELIHLGLSKTPDGFWRIDPSPAFLPDSASGKNETDDDLDADLLDMFPAKVALKHPVAPEPTAVQAKDALIAALAEEHPHGWARLIRAQGDPPDARRAFCRAAQIWWDSRNNTTPKRAVPLAFHETENRAVAVCQFFDTRIPDRLDLKFLFFEKSPMGWLWDPLPSEETRKSLQEWTDRQNVNWQDGWQEAMLRDCIKIDDIPANPPGEAEARKLVEDWIKASQSGDVAAALRLAARLGNQDSPANLLRNLGHEMTGARLYHHPESIIGIHRGDILTAVGTKTDPDEKDSFPLYPIVNTPAGPRILLEIDLLASTARRDFLNRTALEELRKTSAGAADELKKIFDEHKASIEKTSQP